MFGLTHDLNFGLFANYHDSGFTYFPAVSPGEYRKKPSNPDNPYMLITYYHLPVQFETKFCTTNADVARGKGTVF